MSVNASVRNVATTPAERANRLRAFFPLVLFAFAFIIAFGIYRDTIGYGFNYDDYHFVRPYSMAEVAGAFTGTWDSTHIEVPFYRPLTVALFAARFWLFGFDAPLYHWTSILLFACIAMLVGVLLERVTHRTAIAVLATAIVCVQPAMVYSLVAWTTNQMHVAEALLVLCAYFAWLSVRHANAARWWRVLVPSLAALLVKEDAVMIPISVVFLHLLCRRFVDRSLPPVPRWFLAASFIAPAAFAWARYEILGGLGGYGRPDLTTAAWRIRSTIWSLLLQLPPHRPGQRIITVFLAVSLPAGAAIALLRSTSARFVLLAGAAILVCFALPFAFATKVQQVHLATLGTSVVLAGALAGVATVIPGRLPRRLYWSGVACILATMAWVSHSITADFAPRSSGTLYTDGIVQTWSVVPDEIKAMLAGKERGGPVRDVDDLDFVVYGLGSSGGAPSAPRWSADAFDVFTNRRAQSVTFSVRALMIAAIGRNAVRVNVYPRGSRPKLFILTDERWTTLRIPFSRRWFLPAGVPAIRVHVEPTFVPAKVLKNSDFRTLGVQVADIQVQY